MILLEKDIIKDIIDNMTWSFSRLNSFYVCKKNWYFTYIMKRNERENFFSQYGTFVHSIFEKYNKDELEIFQLAEYFNDNYYNNVTIDAPPNKFVDLNESYFNKGYDYFLNFEGNKDKTIVAEVPFEFKLNILNKDRKFIGYIDRLSKDNNGFIVTDYKSKGKFKNKKELKEYTRQLYLYCIAVKETYGVYPYKMIFNQFKENKIEEIYFNENDLNETICWIEDTFKKIYDEESFDENSNDFFCTYLCGTGIEECKK